MIVVHRVSRILRTSAALDLFRSWPRCVGLSSTTNASRSGDVSDFKYTAFRVEVVGAREM